MANTTYLIDSWSFSSFRNFLTNPYKFLLNAMKVWKFKTSQNMLIGDAGHRALEMFFNGASPEEAIAGGLIYIEQYPEKDMRWGKTGSREAAMKKYTFAINAFLAGLPTLGQALAIEQKITALMKTDERFGEPQLFDLPVTSIPDRVDLMPDGDITIFDWKFVTAFTRSEDEKPDRIYQAIFNYHTVKETYCPPGKRVRKFVYAECKTSENAAANKGMPQVQTWTYDFFPEDPEEQAKVMRDFAVFYKLYGLVSEAIAKEDVVFLPNIFDQMNGEETLEAFAAEVVGVDRPKHIKHKLEDVELMTQERKYIPSAADRVENSELTEEEKIRLKFQEFGKAVEMQETYKGPGVIKYTLKPSRGARMRDFDVHEKDIAIALKAKSVRIEAPIMGTDLVGIEIPNPDRQFVPLDIENLGLEAYSLSQGTLMVPMGVDVYGKVVTKDLTEMPHLLVAGATNTGKSVFINTLITSIVAQNSPDNLQLILIDPKRVELAGFRNLPHLMEKVISEIDDAKKTLNWLIEEMEFRYKKLEDAGVRNISEYHENVSSMPYIVVVIDEFADLVLQSRRGKKSKKKLDKETIMKAFAGVDGEAIDPEDLEDPEISIVRLTQKARAVGIHLILATQRPSVDVITGLIKANCPARIAFATSQKVDSQIILDQSGAETLIGKGDLLWLDPSSRSLQRLQGFYI